jgi:hypothetical protein
VVVVVASLLAVAQREAVEAETEEEEAVEEAVEGTVVVATREGKSLINLSVQFC